MDETLGKVVQSKWYFSFAEGVSCTLIYLIYIFFLQNGYSGRTRSLVGDAKFESLVRRESRLLLIEAAKELAVAGGQSGLYRVSDIEGVRQKCVL